MVQCQSGLMWLSNAPSADHADESGLNNVRHALPLAAHASAGEDTAGAIGFHNAAPL